MNITLWREHNKETGQSWARVLYFKWPGGHFWGLLCVILLLLQDLPREGLGILPYILCLLFVGQSIAGTYLSYPEGARAVPPGGAE